MSMPESVLPILEPDRTTMLAHLEHLFGGDLGPYSDGFIELGWTDGYPDTSGKYRLRHAQYFKPNQLDQIVDLAAGLNRTPMVNVYIGAWLKHPNTAPFGRSKDDDAWACFAPYVDLDEPGTAVSAKEHYNGTPPTWLTVTGRNPHPRAQLFWRIRTPITDVSEGEGFMKDLALTFNGDTSVTNAGRVLRLAGSIAWPQKPGRVMELTQQAPLKTPGKVIYEASEVYSAFPPVLHSAATRPGKTERTGSLGLGRLKDGRERYMRNTIFACLIEYIGTNGCDPSPQELFDMAWPQYERNVDLSKPGRGAEEFAQKCIYIIDRFLAGELDGCRSADDAIGIWLRKQSAKQAPPHTSAPQPGLDQDNQDDSELGEIDASELPTVIPPRAWLLGNLFCRRYASSIIADGAVGKTSLRYAQILSLAIGRSLTGDHVFQRCRVLIVSLEDDINEVNRRIEALCLHYGIKRSEYAGRLFIATPGHRGGKLLTMDKHGNTVVGSLSRKLRRTIERRKIDLACLDPFVKTHSVEENNNSLIDEVVQILTDLSIEYDLAIDIPHHTSKGAADPGNANRARGASSMKDAARLVYSLTPMTLEEAQLFNLSEAERRFLVRMDSAKVNIAPPMTEARWFKLVSVDLSNGTATYPAGDKVQAIEPWTPPNMWDRLSHDQIRVILADIERGLPDGNFYTDGNRATDRAAWKVVNRACPELGEAQCRNVISTWLASKPPRLVRFAYTNPKTRKEVDGLKPAADHDQ